MIPFSVRIWMFLSPVAYPASKLLEKLPEGWGWLYNLNPMTGVIEGFRWAVLGLGEPMGPGMLLPVAIVALLLVSGAFVFRRTERTIVDLV